MVLEGLVVLEGGELAAVEVEQLGLHLVRVRGLGLGLGLGVGGGLEVGVGVGVGVGVEVWVGARVEQPGLHLGRKPRARLGGELETKGEVVDVV